VTENEVAREVVDAAFHIHRTVGPGLFESVYKAILSSELEKRGLAVECEQAIPLVYDGMRFAAGFRADLIVERLVIVEVKSIAELAPVHRQQVLTYLRLAEKRLGLLINFNVAMIRDGIVRIVNRL
jgi:GxxExxY protein